MSAILLALALAASPSTKLGVFVAGDDATSQALLAAPVCPRLVVFPLTALNITTAAAQVAAVRSACPGSFVVAQVGDAGMAVTTGTASISWTTSWLTLLSTLGLINFDAVEGPSAPTGSITDLAAFWSEFAVLVRSLVKLPIVGSLATGTPSASFCPTADAMVVALGVNWAWSYHAFSTGLTQDITAETSTTFGYRAIRNGCANLAGIFIYLTQAGPAPGRAWNTSDLAFLTFLDAQLALDGQVVGAALFEAGGSDRSLAPIASELAAFIQNPTAPDGGTPDGGADAGQSGIAQGSGNFVPGGPPGNYPSSGCASAGAGAGLALLAMIVPALVLRRRDRGVKRS
jgi:hypothetical protein